MATALLLTLALLATDAAPPAAGEPLPPGAPTDEYQLTGWCFGALGTYLEIYNVVKPDLIEIDKTWGTTVKGETEPYQSDIAAARAELKLFAGALEAAERASPRPIANQGAVAIKQGQSIWRPVQLKTRRELARAWLSWGLPDRCGVVARELTAKASLLGRALTYNTGDNAAQPNAAAAPAGALAIQPIAPVTPAAPPQTQSQPLAAPQVAPAPPPEPAAEAPPVAVAAAPPPPPAKVIDEPASAPPATTPKPPAAQPVVAAPPAPTPAKPASDEASEPVL